MQQDAGGRRAALAGGAECTPERAFEGEIEIGVVHDDHGVLAAHFERYGLEGGGGALGDVGAHGGGAGEADGADIGMFDDGRACFGAEAGDDVDYARGQPGIDQGLDQVVGRERCIFSRLDDAGVA